MNSNRFNWKVKPLIYWSIQLLSNSTHTCSSSHHEFHWERNQFMLIFDENFSFLSQLELKLNCSKHNYSRKVTKIINSLRRKKFWGDWRRKNWINIKKLFTFLHDSLWFLSELSESLAYCYSDEFCLPSIGSLSLYIITIHSFYHRNNHQVTEG